MNILLDENVPVQLRTHLSGHLVSSVNDAAVGWKNMTNGRLLAAMEGRFDLLITADKNIYTQQNLSGRSISILVLPTNRKRDVLSLTETIATTIDSMQQGSYVVLAMTGEIRTKS